MMPPILNNFPDFEEFYRTYWGRKPFVVRGGIDPSLFKHFIDGDTLAGLSLEEEIKSRLVITDPVNKTWNCEHGPFEKNRFDSLGEENWSLLVQGVDQYHEGTAELLNSFDFSPRWLLDDIMVSYSAKGGSVGPHTDSYHVFLVQGMGKRTWRIGLEPLQQQECIEHEDLKVLKNSVEGEEVTVTIGDVIYIPPHFAHEGTTLEHAMTFSVGFLGPKMSELLIDYGYYLDQMDADNKRYEGQGLSIESAGEDVSKQAQDNIRNDLVEALSADSFSAWLVEYFSSRHDEEDYEFKP